MIHTYRRIIRCLLLLFCTALLVNTLRAQNTVQPIKIVLTGDSTVAEQGGWGPGFCANLTARVTCVNMARNGRSTKSYLDEGLWTQALAEHGQYVFIQFGHNDGKPDAARHTDPDGAFTSNLERFIKDVRASGAVPILVTSLTRRTFQGASLEVDDLARYAAATRHVAAANHVALIDLYALSRHFFDGMTQAQADQFNAEAHPDAPAASDKPDRTHLNKRGQQLFGRMVADEVIRVVPALASDIKPGIAPPDTPAQPALTAAQQTPLNPRLPTLFIVGDSTARNGADLGWGDHLAPYFNTATCINVANRAHAGRSSRTFINEGSWDRVLAEMKPGDYVLLQMGHNDGGDLGGAKPRGTLKGLGEETQDVTLPDGSHETVHTYGWYLRKYIADTRAKGATPILLTLTVRNIWTAGRIERDMGYDALLRQLAAAQHVALVDMGSVAADQFEALGQQKTAALFPKDHTHTSPEGAELNARAVVTALRAAHSPAAACLKP